MQSRIKDKVALLVISDAAAMLLSLIIAFYFGHTGEFTYLHFTRYHLGIITLVVFTFAFQIIYDAYSAFRCPSQFIRQSLHIAMAMFLSAISTTFTYFLFRDAVPRGVFIIFYLCSYALIVLLRYFISKNTHNSYIKVLIVGGKERCTEVTSQIHKLEYLRTKVIGFLSDDDESQHHNGCPYLGRIADLIPVVDQQEVNHIVVAVEPLTDRLTSDLVECMQRRIQVSNFTSVIEQFTGKIPIHLLSDNWFIIELSRMDKRYFWYTKRIADIAIAITGIILASPLMLLTAVAIKLDSHGPVFFKQTRVGRGNRPFKIWKLRTMIDGADKNNVHWTLNDDNRITRTGKILRKIRFDEVPQLLNILTGDMSLIGPRPEAASLVETYIQQIPFYPDRHMIAPGITGWAQINYRYGNTIEDTMQKLMYDFYYIKNRSALLDTTIFLRTIRTVLTGKGAM